MIRRASPADVPAIYALIRNLAEHEGQVVGFALWFLNWNAPARGFYASLGARPMDEWTVHRVTGQAFEDLAGTAPPGVRP